MSYFIFLWKSFFTSDWLLNVRVNFHNDYLTNSDAISLSSIILRNLLVSAFWTKYSAQSRQSVCSLAFVPNVLFQLPWCVDPVQFELSVQQRRFQVAWSIHLDFRTSFGNVRIFLCRPWDYTGRLWVLLKVYTSSLLIIHYSGNSLPNRLRVHYFYSATRGVSS